MHYRPLGRTGLEVSALCLGTMTFGEQNTEAEAHRQLDHAVDNGINFLDAAEMYAVPTRAETQGLTEAFIGSWLAAAGNRDKLIVATKIVGRGDRFPYIRGGRTRFDRKNIAAAVDDSLKRLRTDYIDLYQLHWPDRTGSYFGQLGYVHVEDADPIPIQEQLAALEEQVAAGKIRHIGVSNETAWGLSKFLETADWNGGPRVASIQNPYSLLNRGFEIGLAEVAIREDCGLLAYSPMAGGALSGKYLNGAAPAGSRLDLFGAQFDRYSNALGVEATRAYVDLARERGLDPAQMALAYVTGRPFVTSTIIGATTMTQLAADIASIELSLADDVLAGIEAIHKRIPNPCP